MTTFVISQVRQNEYLKFASLLENRPEHNFGLVKQLVLSHLTGVNNNVTECVSLLAMQLATPNNDEKAILARASSLAGLV